MDQARSWMWTNRRPSGLSSSNLQGSTNDESTWEEQAFAEDASGCVWPPRSYSCSFCGREFASAQALGGHMNVHRRDRARLKQLSPTSQDETLHDDHDHHQVCNPNPNSNHATPSKLNCPEPSSTPKSWSNFVAEERYYHFSDLWTEGERISTPQILESGCSVEADLSVCLNLIVKEEIGCKRKRSDHAALLPFFVKPIPIEFERRKVTDQLSPNEDVDLELRLGPR